MKFAFKISKIQCMESSLKKRPNGKPEKTDHASGECEPEASPKKDVEEFEWWSWSSQLFLWCWKNNKHIFAIICESLLTTSEASCIFEAAGKVAKLVHFLNQTKISKQILNHFAFFQVRWFLTKIFFDFFQRGLWFSRGPRVWDHCCKIASVINVLYLPGPLRLIVRRSSPWNPARERRRWWSSAMKARAMTWRRAVTSAATTTSGRRWRPARGSRRPSAPPTACRRGGTRRWLCQSPPEKKINSGSESGFGARQPIKFTLKEKRGFENV